MKRIWQVGVMFTVVAGSGLTIAPAQQRSGPDPALVAARNAKEKGSDYFCAHAL